MPFLKRPEFENETKVEEQPIGNIAQPEDKIRPKSSARNLPFLMDGDFLQVINDDKRTWDFVWDKRHFPIEPGQMGFVLFEALVDMLGDPRSKDAELVKYQDSYGNKGIVMDRYAELSRLFGRYAVEGENIDELVQRAPKVRCATTLGQAVTFPCQNPSMIPWPTPMADPFHVNSDTTRMIDQVSAENADLRTKVDQLEASIDKILAAREGVETAR